MLMGRFHLVTKHLYSITPDERSNYENFPSFRYMKQFFNGCCDRFIGFSITFKLSRKLFRDVDDLS